MLSWLVRLCNIAWTLGTVPMARGSIKKVWFMLSFCRTVYERDICLYTGLGVPWNLATVEVLKEVKIYLGLLAQAAASMTWLQTKQQIVDE